MQLTLFLCYSLFRTPITCPTTANCFVLSISKGSYSLLNETAVITSFVLFNCLQNNSES